MIRTKKNSETKKEEPSALPELDAKIVKEAQRWVHENHGTKIVDTGYGSPRVSSEMPDCSMPMTFDQYSYCHPAGTLIATVDANNGSIVEKPIEEIQAGEKTLSFSEQDKSMQVGEVLAVGERKTSEIVTIETEDGLLLKLTPEHPVYVEDRGWVKAGDLSENDVLLRIEK